MAARCEIIMFVVLLRLRLFSSDEKPLAHAFPLVLSYRVLRGGVTKEACLSLTLGCKILYDDGQLDTTFNIG